MIFKNDLDSIPFSEVLKQAAFAINKQTAIESIENELEEITKTSQKIFEQKRSLQRQIDCLDYDQVLLDKHYNFLEESLEQIRNSLVVDKYKGK